MLTTTLVAIVPSAGALFLFWVAVRAIVQADRRERAAQARLEAAEAAQAAQAAEAVDAAEEATQEREGAAARRPGPVVPGSSASGGAVNGARGTDAGTTADQGR